MVLTLTKILPDPGQIGDSRNCFMRTEINLEGSTLLGGSLVERYTDGTLYGVRALTDETLIYGVVQLRAYEGAENLNEEDISIIYRGLVYVTASVAVAPGDPVYITPAFALTNVDGGGSNTAWTGVVFIDETTSADQVTRIDIAGGAK